MNVYAERAFTEDVPNTGRKWEHGCSVYPLRFLFLRVRIKLTASPKSSLVDWKLTTGLPNSKLGNSRFQTTLGALMWAAVLSGDQELTHILYHSHAITKQEENGPGTHCRKVLAGFHESGYFRNKTVAILCLSGYYNGVGIHWVRAHQLSPCLNLKDTRSSLIQGNKNSKALLELSYLRLSLSSK